MFYRFGPENRADRKILCAILTINDYSCEQILLIGQYRLFNSYYTSASMIQVISATK